MFTLDRVALLVWPSEKVILFTQPITGSLAWWRDGRDYRVEAEEGMVWWKVWCGEKCGRAREARHVFVSIPK